MTFAKHDIAKTSSGSIQSILDAGAGQLRKAGMDSPELDARVLLCHASGLSHAQILSRNEQALGEADARAFDALLARRLKHEPVSRILGRRGFWKGELKISPHTLDPRPDTETLVEFVLEHAQARLEQALQILDLGCGTGAILCALLGELPNGTGVGLDISQEACAIASQNTVDVGQDGRAQIKCGDWRGESLKSAAPGRFDIIVSNPPYIPSNEIASLAPEVRLHDPLIALDGGLDGLDGFRAIAAAARELLKPGGLLAFEIGMGQHDAVRTIMNDFGLQDAGEKRDLAGHIRVLGGTGDG